jgi:HEAT repeat protein
MPSLADRAGSTAAPDLEQALKILIEGDFQARWQVAKRFPEFGQVAIAPLLTLAQDEQRDWEVRWFAIKILGHFREPQVIAELANLVTVTADDDLSALAAQTLAAIGPETIAALSALLSQPGHRRQAVQALAQIRQQAVIEPLLSVINDADADLRRQTLEALGSFHDARVTPLLLAALGDPASSVRQEAIQTLGRRPDLRQSHQLVAHLQNCLWDINLSVCQTTVVALGRLGGPESVPPLQRLMQSEATPDELKQAAVRALSWIPHEAALQALCESLALPSERVRHEIILALGYLAAPWQQPAAAQLMALLAHPDLSEWPGEMKQAIACSLAKLNATDAFDALVGLLADPDPRVRLHTLSALKQLAPANARQRLQQSLAALTLPELLRAGIRDSLEAW